MTIKDYLKSLAIFLAFFFAGTAVYGCFGYAAAQKAGLFWVAGFATLATILYFAYKVYKKVFPDAPKNNNK